MKEKDLANEITSLKNKIDELKKKRGMIKVLCQLTKDHLKMILNDVISQIITIVIHLQTKSQETEFRVVLIKCDFSLLA